MLIFFTACEEQLNVQPRGEKTNKSFYQNESDANSAVIACYAELRLIYGGTNNGEVINGPNTYMADDAVPFLTGSADRLRLWNYTFDTNNDFILWIWQTAYRGIQLANIVINKVPKIQMDEDLKRQFIAEAKFNRAVNYFNLVRFFDDIPYITEEYNNLDSVYVGKSSTEEIYSLIEEDLEDAENGLPIRYQDKNHGRATIGAAKSLLAKVYLTEAGNDRTSPFWEKSYKKAEEVMNMGIYSLWDDYANAFTLDNRLGKESIFEILFNSDFGNNYTTGYAPRNFPFSPANGFGISRVSKSLYSSFSKKDQRISASFLTYYLDENGDTTNLSIDDPDPSNAISFWKFADSSSTKTGGDQKSFTYLRYSDILLTYAEALNESIGSPTISAYDALNRVRLRAGLDEVNNLNYSQFRDSVLVERRREFSFEGQRWFDLKRRELLIQAVKEENSFNRNAAINKNTLVLPFPQSELDANPNLR